MPLSQVTHVSFVLFVPSDAYRHRQDHHLAFTHHLIPAGAPRDWETGVLYPHCARDGKGPSGAQRAGRLSSQVTNPCCCTSLAATTSSVWVYTHMYNMSLLVSRTFHTIFKHASHNTLHQHTAALRTPSSMPRVSRICEIYHVCMLFCLYVLE